MFPGWIGLLAALLLVCGCVTGLGTGKELHRLDDVNALPKDARIGLTEFTVCGGSYLDKINPESLAKNSKAVFFRKCTEIGHPKLFSARLRQRLEDRLGRKIVLVKTDKSYKPKQVLNEAGTSRLDYVIAGDLLYLGERDKRTVVSAVFYLIRVADGKIVVVGRVKKDGALGKINSVINDVADELIVKAFEE